MAAKIKKGDKVVILVGKDKGKTGSVTQIFPTETKATVQGLNLVRRHTKQSAAQEAGIYTKEAPIQLSNLALMDTNGKPTRTPSRAAPSGRSTPPRTWTIRTTRG